MGKIQFFMSAHENALSMSEANILWQTAASCNMAEPMSVFWSGEAMSRVLSKIKNDVDAKRDEKSDKESLLRKLYDIRTKIEREEDKKRGLPSSKDLGRDIKIRIVLPGKGLFTSAIVNNTPDELVVSMPMNGITPIKMDEWVHKTITIYVWKENDAEYSFDTEVLGHALFFGHPVLHLKHTNTMLRTQKRRAVRAKCKIYGSLYIIKSNDDLNFDKIETRPGYKCLIEDISETGALIQIAGKGQPKAKIRIQFEIAGRLVAMFGVVRTVEYNEAKSRSRLHFECLHISDAMRNHILAYVYNMADTADVEVGE